MFSSILRKSRYIKDKCVNAYWMIRRGDFKLLRESARMEFNLRAMQVKSAMHDLQYKFHQMRYSYYQRQQRHHELRSSFHQRRIDYHQQRLTRVLLRQEALYIYLEGARDKDNVADSTFSNLRKVIPSSYRPTTSAPYGALQLQVDPAAVELEIRQILSTFTVQDSGTP